jgi:hypothetical protein
MQADLAILPADAAACHCDRQPSHSYSNSTTAATSQQLQQVNNFNMPPHAIVTDSHRTATATALQQQQVNNFNKSTTSTSQQLQQVNNRSRLRSMKLMKVPALPALCSDITDEMVESENAVICLPPALCSDITDRGSGGPHARRQSSRGRPRLPQHVATHPHPATLRGNLGTCLEHFFVTASVTFP